MKTIKQISRYRTRPCGSFLEIHKVWDGQWVRYEDVKKLLSKLGYEFEPETKPLDFYEREWGKPVNKKWGAI